MSDSDNDYDGPVQYDDDDDIYDSSNPDRSSIISTGARASRQYRESRSSFIPNRDTYQKKKEVRDSSDVENKGQLFGVVPDNITQLITQDAYQDKNKNKD